MGKFLFQTKPTFLAFGPPLVFLLALMTGLLLSLPVDSWAQDSFAEETSVQESLPIAPQSFDGFGGVPQTSFAPRPGEVLAVKPKTLPLVKTPRKVLKNLRVAR